MRLKELGNQRKQYNKIYISFHDIQSLFVFKFMDIRFNYFTGILLPDRFPRLPVPVIVIISFNDFTFLIPRQLEPVQIVIFIGNCPTRRVDDF